MKTLGAEKARLRLNPFSYQYFLALLKPCVASFTSLVVNRAAARGRQAPRDLSAEEIISWLVSEHFPRPMTGRRATQGRWYVDRFLHVWEPVGEEEPDTAKSVTPAYRQQWIDTLTPHLPGDRASVEWQPAPGLLQAIDDLPGGSAAMEDILLQSEAIFRLQFAMCTGCVPYHYVRTLPRAAVNAGMGNIDLDRMEVPEADADAPQISFLRLHEHQVTFLANPTARHLLTPELQRLWNDFTLPAGQAAYPHGTDDVRALGFHLMSCNLSWKVFHVKPLSCFTRGKSGVYEGCVALEAAAEQHFPAQGKTYAPIRNAWRWYVRQFLIQSQGTHPGIARAMQILELIWKPAALIDASHALVDAYWSTPKLSQDQAYARIRLMLRHGGRECRAVTSETLDALAALDALLASHMAALVSPGIPQQQQKEHVRLLDRLLRRGMAAAFAEMLDLDANALLEKLGQALFHDLQTLGPADLPNPMDIQLAVPPQPLNPR